MLKSSSDKCIGHRHTSDLVGILSWQVIYREGVQSCSVAVLLHPSGKSMKNEKNVRENTQPRCQTGASGIHSYSLVTIRISSVVITWTKALNNSESLILISVNLKRVLCDCTHVLYFYYTTASFLFCLVHILPSFVNVFNSKWGSLTSILQRLAKKEKTGVHCPVTTRNGLPTITSRLTLEFTQTPILLERLTLTSGGNSTSGWVWGDTYRLPMLMNFPVTFHRIY